MNFGDFIKKHRLAKGLPLTELARRADISRAYLTQIENGTKEPPSEKYLIKLAEELDIPLKVMLTVANEELFTEEYISSSIAYGEIYQKLTAIQENLEELLPGKRNITDQYVIKKEVRNLESLKASLNDIRELHNKIANTIKKPVLEQNFPQKTEKIINELLQFGERGQAYVMEQIEIYKKYF